MMRLWGGGLARTLLDSMTVLANRYAYVAQNPIKYVDPEGLFCVATRIVASPWITYKREISPLSDWTFRFSYS